MIGSLAVVVKVLPERHGVMVRHPDGLPSMDTGDESGPFVRVLARRAHGSGGADVCLPEVGELGAVLELDDGYLVWLGSVHWQDFNWVDPTEALEMHRHTSGVRRQVRENGDMQFDHPSGLRITIAQTEGALPDLQRKGDAELPPPGDCNIDISHPSGLRFTVDKEGAITVAFPLGAMIAVDRDEKLTLEGFQEVNLQDANARFVMEPLIDWLKNHKHTAQGATAITTAPTSNPPASALSPTSFKGPHA